MAIKSRNIFFAVIFIFLLPSVILPYGLSLSKTADKTTVTLGDTVTFCLYVIPQKITFTTKADIVWVVDVTESMRGSVLNSIKDNIVSFTGELSASGIDYRQGLVSFRDSTYTHLTYDADVNYGFAATDSQFLTWVNALSAYEGGDIPETGLEALLDAAFVADAWRSDASKMLILITDTRVKCVDDRTGPLSMTYTAAALSSENFSVFPVSYDWTAYGGNPKDLASLTGGTWLDFGSTSSEWLSFFDILLGDAGRYTGVVVTDTLPSQLSFTGGACDAVMDGNLAAWNITYIPAGTTYTVCCFTAYINSAFSGCVYNTAYVYADGVSIVSSTTKRLCYVTPTVTKTVTLTRTATATFTGTRTYTDTPEASVTNTPSSSATGSATSTPTITVTPSSSVTFSPTMTSTATDTATVTATASITLTPTVSPFVTGTFTLTVTKTPTISATASATPTLTYTGTITITLTATCTKTITPTMTPAPVISPTGTRTPDVPLLLNLKGSFPNPFITDTNFVYWISRDADIKIKIFTVSGEIVRVADGIKAYAGWNRFYWDGKNNSGKKVSSGVFIYRITASAGTYGETSAMSKCACVR